MLCALMVMFYQSDALARVDLLADQVVRDTYGALTATGHVEAQRQDEVLYSDKLHYDPLSKEMHAEGNIRLSSPKAEIQAKSAQLHTVNKTGSLQQVRMRLPEGQNIQADSLQRLNETLYRGKNIRFSECSLDDPAWQMYAEDLEIDQEEGVLTVRHARFEVGGVPIFYSPYWQYPLRRRSGFLMPMVSTSQRRGTEIALPYFSAPWKHIDATLTPHWMTVRGLMGELELRHASTIGVEQLRLAALRDRITSGRRYQLEGNIRESLPLGWTLQADINQTSDSQFLSDFSTDGSQASARFIQSKASLAWQGKFGYLSLMAQKQQDLTRVNNDRTLQLLPRIDSAFIIPLPFDAQLHLDQQTTRFSRPQLINGWRMYAHPWLELPFAPFHGAVDISMKTGLHQWNYWQLKNHPERAARARAYHSSVQASMYLERISENRHWRHAITPIVRFDHATAPDQSLLPRFDTSFGRLTMSNLLQGNRYAGFDRVERMRRLSAVVEHELQYKDEETGRKWSVLTMNIGTAWDFIRSSVDPVLNPAPLRNYGNLLGGFSLSPNPNFHVAADGQYDPVSRYWASVNASLTVDHDDGHHLTASWHHTDARYVPTAINLVGLDVVAKIYRHWRLSALWQYDSALKLTQQATASIKYEHPCWNISLEGFLINRQGSTGSSDSGFRFMVGFKGLGDVGK